jgi:hypothetical protein
MRADGDLSSELVSRYTLITSTERIYYSLAFQ